MFGAMPVAKGRSVRKKVTKAANSVPRMIMEEKRIARRQLGIWVDVPGVHASEV